MIFKNKQILKRAIMLLIMLAPILCMGDYVPGIVLARLKRGVVELPQGQRLSGYTDVGRSLTSETKVLDKSAVAWYYE